MTEQRLPSLRDYARGATGQGLSMLIPFVFFGCLLAFELFQARSATAAALAVLGGLPGLAVGLFGPSPGKRVRAIRRVLAQLTPDEQARWERIVIVHGRSRRGTVVLGLPGLCLLTVLVYGVMTWPWTLPSLGLIVGVGLTSALAMGALVWTLQWLVVAWYAYADARGSQLA
jgi:hypothetical protein